MARNREDTHERILDAAEPLVTANGFAGTSIDDILKSAGLTKGAFFHHFKSKADLARELIERHARRDIALFEELRARGRKAEPGSAGADDPLPRRVRGLCQQLQETGFRGPAGLHVRRLYV